MIQYSTKNLGDPAPDHPLLPQLTARHFPKLSHRLAIAQHIMGEICIGRAAASSATMNMLRAMLGEATGHAARLEAIETRAAAAAVSGTTGLPVWPRRGLQPARVAEVRPTPLAGAPDSDGETP